MPPQPDNKLLTPDEVQNKINEKMEDARARLKADARVEMAGEVAKRMNAADGTNLTAEQGLGVLAPSYDDKDLTGVGPANFEALSGVTTVLSNEEKISNLMTIGGMTREAAIAFVLEHCEPKPDS